MTSIITISDDKTLEFNGNFSDLFSSDNLKKIAESAGQLKRERKFRIDTFVYSTLKFFNESPKEQNVTLANLKRAYDSLAQKENILEQKPFYLQMAKEEMYETAYKLLHTLISFTLNKIAPKAQKHMKSLNSLCKKAQVDDIIMVDG